MIFLAIECSTLHGSVALTDGQALLLEEHFPADRRCGSELFAVLERALAVTKPERIVIGLGPGSYSGVRIAIASAIGLSAGTGARLLGIPSIVALEEPPLHYLTAGDARRNSFHFAEVKKGRCLEGPLLLSPEELESRIQVNQLPVVGSSAIGFLPQLQLRQPEARRLAQLAAAGISIVAEERLEPIYLREPHITVAKPVFGA